MVTYKDFHIKGGTLVQIGIKERQCSELCMRNPYCLAFDYNTVHAQCWFHSGDSYCGLLERRVGCTHYKRIPCVEGDRFICFLLVFFWTDVNKCTVYTQYFDTLWCTLVRNLIVRGVPKKMPSKLNLDKHSPRIIQIFS